MKYNRKEGEVTQEVIDNSRNNLIKDKGEQYEYIYCVF